MKIRDAVAVLDSRALDALIAEELFGWRRWIAGPYGAGANEVHIQPPEWPLYGKTEEEYLARCFPSERHMPRCATPAHGPVTHHPVTPEYSMNWNKAMQLRGWAIKAGLRSELKEEFRFQVKSRGPEPDRDGFLHAEPVDLARAALVVCRRNA